jgi:hypothetical protein
MLTQKKKVKYQNWASEGEDMVVGDVSQFRHEDSVEVVFVLIVDYVD